MSQAKLTQFESTSSNQEFPAPDTPEDLLSVAPRYAQYVVEMHDMDVPLDEVEWDISHRAKRRAGVCIYDKDSEDITVRLTWDAYEVNGWENMKDTIRHELVHAEQYHRFGESGHGVRFKRRADEVDASQNCEAFTDAKFTLNCAGCGVMSGRRHRICKTVKEPSVYDSQQCDCPTYTGLRVTHNESGEVWDDSDGYAAVSHKL